MSFIVVTMQYLNLCTFSLEVTISSLKQLKYIVICRCLQCFDTVGWVAGRASGPEKLSDEVLCGYLSGAKHK